MVWPLVALGLIAGSQMVKAGANLYSQSKQRDFYRYQKAGYERQLSDWHRNVPGREIRYPELSYPGHIRALDTGISQSYASSVSSAAGLAGNLAAGYGYARHGGLFNSTFKSSRWL